MADSDVELLDEIRVETIPGEVNAQPKEPRKRPALAQIHPDFTPQMPSTTYTASTEDFLTTNFDFSPPAKRPTLPGGPQAKTSRDLILQARDYLIQAAAVEKAQEEKTRILDLIEVFREYTEKKKINSVSNILANQVSDLERVARSLKTTAKPTKQPTQPQAPTPPTASSKSFAEVAANASPTPPSQWQVVGKGKAASKENHREKRLVLVQSVKTQDIDPLQLRNTLNEAFQKHSIKEPVVATVAKSRFGQNIVVTTTDRFNADFLLAHESVWQKIIPYSSATKDSAWFKVVAHGVPVRDFDTEGGMASLKDEVETFNKGLKVVGSPRWLTSHSARETKRMGSVVIAFATEKEAMQATRSRLYIAGSSVKTEKLLPFRADTQCSKCQRFGHPESKCRSTYKCRLCAENHPTDLHVCSTCSTRGKRCPHLVAKCCNCNDGHTADSKDCDVFLEARAKTQSTFLHI